MTRDQEYTILPVRPKRNWLAIALVSVILALQLLTLAILTFKDCPCSQPVVTPTPSVTVVPTTVHPTVTTAPTHATTAPTVQPTEATVDPTAPEAGG